jgi:hypothetical protein
MRAELAQRLLNQVMGWSTGEFQKYVPDLRVLAEIKYDEYGQYGPGGKFIENLAGWLDQFPPDRRQTALDFVMDRLVFISETEMRHLVGLVPSAILSPVLRARVAAAAGLEVHRVAQIERHEEFGLLRRKSLILGASDGARLDQLRRASGLSHEQFLPTPAPSRRQLDDLVDKLRKAPIVGDAEARFEHVFLVDDFSGSGSTLLRAREDGSGHTGKIMRLQDRLDSAVEKGLIAENVPSTAVVYCAAQQALDHVNECISDAGLVGWTIEPVQVLRNSLKVTETDPDMAQLCEDFFDESSVDPDKGRAPVGYSDCALPLVLSHNAPNNSVCLLWLDTRGKPGSADLRALFPRYERHHPDRR